MRDKQKKNQTQPKPAKPVEQGETAPENKK